jgi:hypothetical protein
MLNNSAAVQNGFKSVISEQIKMFQKNVDFKK